MDDLKLYAHVLHHLNARLTQGSCTHHSGEKYELS